MLNRPSVKEYFNCVQCLKDVGIIPINDKVADKSIYLSNYKKWALKHHPDKGGDGTIFATINHCVDVVIKQNDYDEKTLDNPLYPSFKTWVRNIHRDRYRRYAHHFTLDPNLLTNNLCLLIIDTFVSLTMLPHPVLPNNISGYITEVHSDHLIISDGYQLITINLDAITQLWIAYHNEQLGQYCEKLFKCPPDKVYNPKSGRYVNKNGKLGKEIIRNSKISTLDMKS